MATPPVNQEVVIDLIKSPDVANALTDAQPGDEVKLIGVIKSKDDQSLVVTVRDVDGDDMDSDGVPGNEGSGDVQDAPSSNLSTNEDAAV